MREPRNNPKRLKDILQAINTIFLYMDNRGKDDFLADKMAYHALMLKGTKSL